VCTRGADVPALESILADQAIPWFPVIFSISPNAESCLPILQALEVFAVDDPRYVVGLLIKPNDEEKHYLGESRRLLVPPHGQGSTHDALLRAAQDTLGNLHECSPSALMHASRDLELSAAHLLTVDLASVNPLTVPLAKYLQAFTRVLARLDEGVLHVRSDLSSRAKSWWSQASTLEAELKTSLAQFDGLIGLPTPVELVAFRTWLEGMIFQIERLHLTKVVDKNKHATVLRQTAAWFMGRALRHRDAGRTGWAMLFLQRAADWATMGKMAALGHIDFVVAGGEIKAGLTPNTQDRRPGITNNLYALQNGNAIRQHLYDCLTDLNNWRNYSPYAHHMAVADDRVAQKIFDHVIRALPAFIASSDWDHACSQLYQRIPVDAYSLLDADGLLRAGVTRV